MSKHYEEDDRIPEAIDVSGELATAPQRWPERALAAIANGRHDLRIGPFRSARRDATLRVYLIDTEAKDHGLIVIAALRYRDALSDLGTFTIYKASDIFDAEGRYDTNAWASFADVVGQYQLKHLKAEWQRRVRAKQPVEPAVENPF